jgi:hypothetical protein
VLRHGFAALVVLALVVPLLPAANGTMACCRGGGEACACPIERGFSRCEAAASLAPVQTPPALLSPAVPAFALTASLQKSPEPTESLCSLAPRPPVPPPRA